MVKEKVKEVDAIYRLIFTKWKNKYNIPIKVFKTIFFKRVERISRSNKYAMTEKEIEIWALGSMATDLWKLVQ